ncbi:MAG TPA: AI-2E family transporter [Chitinophagaceae bacterium]
MIREPIVFPYYAKLALILLTLFLLFYGVYLGQDILLPLGFAFLLSILLRPLELFITSCRVPKSAAILLSILFAVLFVYGIIDFISRQIASFMSDIPAIERNLNQLWRETKRWGYETFGINYRQQDQMLESAKTGTINSLGGSSQTFNLITASVLTLTLIPIYIFLFMYYRPMLLQFVVDLFDESHTPRVKEVIREIKNVIQHFVVGLLIETGIVAAANTIGLLIIGAPYAALLGILGALLNMIPYIGGIVQLIFSALVIYSNTASIPMLLWATAILLVVQFIDNNILVPWIIGNKVQLNSLISIIGVLLGGALAGIGGMFLSIPMLAICKVIFDRVDELKPWGRLFGTNDDPSKSYLKMPRRRKRLPPPPAG